MVQCEEYRAFALQVDLYTMIRKMNWGHAKRFDARDLSSNEVSYDLHFHIGILAAYISSISAKVRPRVSGMKK